MKQLWKGLEAENLITNVGICGDAVIGLHFGYLTVFAMKFRSGRPFVSKHIRKNANPMFLGDHGSNCYIQA